MGSQVNSKEQDMWSKTTFEWGGHGIRDRVVTNFGLRDNEPTFRIRNLGVWIENNRIGHLDVEFGPIGLGDISRGVTELSEYLFNKFGECGYVHNGSLYKFRFSPINGENITVTMAKNLILLLKVCCGSMTPLLPPRIVTENFKGKFCGDIKPEKSYGQQLFEDLLVLGVMIK